MRNKAWVLLTLCLAGCAALGAEPLNVPPEYKQKVILVVDDEYYMHQAPRSTYDVGDLQNFHSQHTLPVIIEDAFKEVFGQVKVVGKEAHIETTQPDVPAIFEVRVADVANDLFSGSDSYRGEVTLAVAMKSPRGKVFWQKVFRGEGYVKVDPQFSTGLGPQDAMLDAMRDAITQMQQAIVSSPQVSNQMKHYAEVEQARREKEVTV